MQGVQEDDRCWSPFYLVQRHMGILKMDKSCCVARPPRKKGPPPTPAQTHAYAPELKKPQKQPAPKAPKVGLSRGGAGAGRQQVDSPPGGSARLGMPLGQTVQPNSGGGHAIVRELPTPPSPFLALKRRSGAKRYIKVGCQKCTSRW